MSEHEGERPHYRVDIPPELKGGVYANFFTVWHSAYEFTLDFSATQRPELAEDEASVVIPCQLVSRVRMPVTLIFDLLKVMNQSMTHYEEAFGEIRPPRPQEGAA